MHRVSPCCRHSFSCRQVMPGLPGALARAPRRVDFRHVASTRGCGRADTTACRCAASECVVVLLASTSVGSAPLTGTSFTGIASDADLAVSSTDIAHGHSVR
jgi:hypothetical protein